MAKRNTLENILINFKTGSRKDYDDLVSRLSCPTLSDEHLLKYLKQVKDCATLLDDDFEVLVGRLLTIHWTSRPLPIIQLYQSMMLNIVSVHTVYLTACLRQLIKSFMPVAVVKKDGDNTEADIDEETLIEHNERFKHVHTLIKTITQIVPMSTNMIVPLLVDSYPYLTKGVYLQECFLRNALQITFYSPSLRVQILHLIIEKIIKIDVRCPRLTMLAMKEHDESQESGIFCMDDVDPVTDCSNKLDALMNYMFEYIDNVCMNNERLYECDLLPECSQILKADFSEIEWVVQTGRDCVMVRELAWDRTKTFYREMLLVFEKVILPTYACCHVQFIMFYLVSLKMPLCDGFLDYLWKLVQNPNAHTIHRQSAVAYMGSLLARAKFVSIKTVMKTLELMMGWAHSYTQMCQDCVMADVSRHGAFYSVCQSVFYAFAFRQKEILETKKGLKWAEGLQFQHLLHSRLNPLKVCLPIVVKTFASITRQHQLAFCDHIIEQNNRSFIPVESSCTKDVLDTYFPFDPYLLKESSKYIVPLYREYDHSVEMAEDSSGEEDDDDDMFTEDVSTSSELSMTPGSLGVKGQLDLMNYGTSPGFKHMY